MSLAVAAAGPVMVEGAILEALPVLQVHSRYYDVQSESYLKMLSD